MAFIQAMILLMLLAGSVLLADAANHIAQQAHNQVFLRGLSANISINTTLLSAPYYRNVSAGAAWVIPKSEYDLGARDMNCECFDPSQTCCIAKAHNVAPFCIPKNSTCCSDAFCNPGETCCGDSCCPADTTCNIKITGSGCCPKSQICSGPPVCYDHSSANCTNTFFPAQQCCPPNIPFCRDFRPNGLGCYAMSSLAAASTTVGFASPGFAWTANTTESGITTTWSSTMTITETVTMVNEGSGSLSIAFPGTTVTGPPFPAVVTSTVWVFSSASLSSSDTQTTPRSIPSNLATSNSFTSTSTSTSALCFDPTLQSAAPCSRSTTATSSFSASGVFAPPSASTFNSQATSLLPPIGISLTQIRDCAVYLTLTLAIAASGMLLLTSEKERSTSHTISKSSIHLVPGSGRVLRGTLEREIKVLEDSGRVLRGTLEREIKVLDDSGRVLRGELGKEIKVVKSTGRVWKEPFAVDKTRIQVVEGSGRALEI